MSFVFISSTGDHAGQSLITWALARKLTEQGLSVGFFKPFGTTAGSAEGASTDHDALLFKKVLHLEEPVEHICPYPFTGEEYYPDTDDLIREIREHSRILADPYDLLLVMGSLHIFFDTITPPLSDTVIISALQADCVLVHRYHKRPATLYSLLSVSSLLKEKLKGIIINRVPGHSQEEVVNSVAPALSCRSLPITSVIPEDPSLSFCSIEEIRERCNGEVLCGEEWLSQPVGLLTAGSADLTGDLQSFKRVYNKIVMLSPLPPAAETGGTFKPRSVAGILLTGGVGIAPQLIDAACRAKIPVIVVEDDAFVAMERLERGSSSISYRDTAKLDHITELMERNHAFERLFRSLKITP